MFPSSPFGKPQTVLVLYVKNIQNFPHFYLLENIFFLISVSVKKETCCSQHNNVDMIMLISRMILLQNRRCNYPRTDNCHFSLSVSSLQCHCTSKSFTLLRNISSSDQICHSRIELAFVRKCRFYISCVKRICRQLAIRVTRKKFRSVSSRLSSRVFLKSLLYSSRRSFFCPLEQKVSLMRAFQRDLLEVH